MKPSISASKLFDLRVRRLIVALPSRSTPHIFVSWVVCDARRVPQPCQGRLHRYGAGGRETRTVSVKSSTNSVEPSGSATRRFVNMDLREIAREKERWFGIVSNGGLSC
jgi:hypothetical protein